MVSGPTSQSAGTRNLRGRSGSRLRSSITAIATMKKA